MSKEGKNPEPSSQDARLLSLDVLRAIAVILMVQQHLGVWLFPAGESFSSVARGLIWLNMLGGLAAPLFIFLAGVSVAVGHLRGDVLVKRGIALFLMGILLNLGVPSWFSEGSFYVLHLLGVWLVLAPTLRWLDDATLLLLAGLCLLGAVLGQNWLETPLHLNNARLADADLPGGPLRLAFFEGNFPIFPWLSLSLIGLWAGKAMTGGNLARLPRLGVGLLVLIGLSQLPRAGVFGTIDIRLLPWRVVSRFSFYPASVVLITIVALVCVLLLWIFIRLERAGLLRSVRGLRYLGQTSLTLLVFHILVFREGSIRLGVWQSFGVLETLSAIASLLLIWSVLAEIWSRAGYKFGLEWILRRVSGRERQEEET